MAAGPNAGDGRLNPYKSEFVRKMAELAERGVEAIREAVEAFDEETLREALQIDVAVYPIPRVGE